MEIQNAIDRLAALAQEHRLAIYRHLVTRGPAGEPAGMIGEKFGLPAATLSFHLNQLVQAGLLRRRREGRQIFYSADYPAMNTLIDFLTENCCVADPSCGRNAETGESSCNDGNNEES